MGPAYVGLDLSERCCGCYSPLPHGAGEVPLT